MSVMDASERDTKLFHRLVRRQRVRPSTAPEILQFNGSTLAGAEEIAAGFSSHFRDLATPTPNESFDSEYFRQVQYDALVIEGLCSRQVGCTFKPVETAEIFSIVRSFRNGKAKNIHGLFAEHLKQAVEIVALPLASLMNFVLSTAISRPCCCKGLLTPVPKKDKDQTLPTNYKGITVLSILGKVLQNRTDLLTKNQSRLQRGFTKKSSSVNAALFISEVQNEAKDRGEFLSLVTLDAAKAFDVVWQVSLLRKIYHEGVDGTLWLTLSCMYSNAITSVKWGPHISSSFPIKQGVRQGGILSTTHYKLFNNGLLHTMDESGLGASIGCFKCGAPTCADDVAVLGNKVFYVRCMVEIVRGYCRLERYTIHPQKSEEVVLNCEKDSQSEVEIKCGNEPIKKVKSTMHLELNVVKQVDPMSRRRFNWGGGPCIVLWELVSVGAPDSTQWFLLNSGSFMPCQEFFMV